MLSCVRKAFFVFKELPQLAREPTEFFVFQSESLVRTKGIAVVVIIHAKTETKSSY